jgi:hypothetical protein
MVTAVTFREWKLPEIRTVIKGHCRSMNRRTRLFAPILSMASLMLLHGGAKAFEPVVTDHSFNTWWTANARYDITQRWNVTGLVMLRRANGLSDWQQYVLRPNVGFAVNRHIEVGLGYTHAHMFPYGNQAVPLEFTENNIFQQLILRQTAGRVGLMHRVRLEQRFVDHVEHSADRGAYIEGKDYMNRFRFRMDGMVPVALNDRLFVSVFDEVFVHLQDEMTPDAFDQNRAYIGLGYRLNDKLKFELGMLHHYLRKRDGVHFESNPTMQMGVGFQFGPVKRKTPSFPDRQPI